MGGLAQPVDDLLQHQKCLGVKQAQSPAIPESPRKPNTSNDRDHHHHCDHHKKKCELHTHLRNKVFKATAAKFLGALKAKQAEDGSLLLDHTAREAFDCIELTVSEEIERRTAFTDITKAMGECTVDPQSDNQALVTHLQEMKQDKHSMDLLDCGSVPWENIIILCQQALHHSGLDKLGPQKIDKEWANTKPTSKESINGTTPLPWMAFNDHHIT